MKSNINVAIVRSESIREIYVQLTSQRNSSINFHFKLNTRFVKD